MKINRFFLSSLSQMLCLVFTWLQGFKIGPVSFQECLQVLFLICKWFWTKLIERSCTLQFSIFANCSLHTIIWFTVGKSTKTLPDIPDLMSGMEKRQDIILGKKSEILRENPNIILAEMIQMHMCISNRDCHLKTIAFRKKSSKNLGRSWRKSGEL